MKQRDLLFAALLLLGVPAFAQDGPTIDAEKDAKVIFTQNFEADWETWCNTPIDSITVLEYYQNAQTKNGTSYKPWSSPNDWKRGLFRTDSVNPAGRGGIIMYNGVVVCDETAKTGEDWSDDLSEIRIVSDNSTARKNAMAEYGEADKGGQYMFKYVSDTIIKAGSNSWTTSGQTAARYRRNLFVRLNPGDIQEKSSYRLTFYAKASTAPGHEVTKPTLFADVMRGYFHGEKPFSMSYFNKDGTFSSHSTNFNYTKDDFREGVWEKCTFMTYYSTAAIADNYVFVDGYWWAEDSSWFWKKGSEGNPTGQDLRFIVQPDKFFVRLGFASNYSEYYIDNISLTKSWIGGCEYWGDKMRIDFGYQTNLKELAEKAYKKTRIAAVPIPGEYFEVWGQLSSGEWEEVYMESAEYHDNGYMYMFTDTYEDPRTHKDVHYDFSDYEKVLVTFHNPADTTMQLKYTGNLYPKVDDRDWVDAGKIVPDFYNELATPNQYVFSGIYPIYDLPPVFQGGITAEENSFRLDPKTRELKFKFTREMEIDDKMEASTKLVVYVDVNGVEEVWTPTWEEANKALKITRPTKYTTDLAGDAEIHINQVYLPGENRKGDDVTVFYHFGAITRDVEYPAINAAAFAFEGENSSVPFGSATFSGVSNSRWTGNYRIGNGEAWNEGNRMRMFTHEVEGSVLRRGVEIRPHNGSGGGHLYMGVGEAYKIRLNAGKYKLSFKGVGWQWGGQDVKPVDVYVFAYNPAFTDGSPTAPPRTADADKIFLGTYNPKIIEQDGDLQNAEHAIPAADNVALNFAVDVDTAYIFEVVNTAGNWSQGSFVGDFELVDMTNSSFSDEYIINLNKAVAAAKARKALAGDAAKYAGADLTALNAQITANDKGGSFDQSKPTAPSVWEAATNATIAATNALKVRMDTVNLLDNTAADVAKKIAACTGDSAKLDALTTLKASKAIYDNAYPYSSKSNAELSAFIKTLKDQMDAIDTRVKKIGDWDSLLVIANALITAKEKETYVEYDNLKSACQNIAADFKWSSKDADFMAKFALIEDAVYAYSSAVELEKVAMRRINELKALATKYGTNVADSSFVKAALDTLRTDADDYLALVFKAYIKAAMYDKIANGGGITSEDLSAFMKNYYLYATPIVENPYAKDADLKDGSATSSVPAKADRKVEGSNIYHQKHQHNKSNIWITFFDEEITNLFPGWTLIVSQVSNGNNMVTPDIQTTDDTGEKTYPTFNNGPVAAFDGALSMDWNSSASLSTEVTTLPVGEYDLGVEHRALHRASQAGGTKKSNLNLYVTTAKGTSIFANTFNGDYMGPDSVLLLRESTGLLDSLVAMTAINGDTVFDTIKVRKLEKIAIAEDDTLRLNVSLQSNSGNDRIDNFSLTFKPKAGYGYAAAATAAKNEAISILTVVDAAKSIADKVEYYSLSGMKLNAPKRGEILVRKRTLANGKVVVDKVLIK